MDRIKSIGCIPFPSFDVYALPLHLFLYVVMSNLLLFINIILYVYE